MGWKYLCPLWQFYVANYHSKCVLGWLSFYDLRFLVFLYFILRYKREKIKYYKCLSSEWQRKSNWKKHEVRRCKCISNENYPVLLMSNFCSVCVETVNVCFGGKEWFFIFWSYENFISKNSHLGPFINHSILLSWYRIISRDKFIS